MASPQLELLRCATLQPSEALLEWEQLVRRVPVEDFDHHAQRLLSSVWVNLKKASKNFSDEPRLRGIHRRTWVHNKRLKGAAIGVLELLASVKIPTMVLKGLAYNEIFYLDSGMRPSWDFDIFVPLQQAEQALVLLEADGWVIKHDRHVPLERFEHGATLVKDGLELDLHWNLLREARNPEQDLPFWQEAVPIELDGCSTLTLSPNHQLFFLLAIANREPENLSRYLVDLFFFTRHSGQIFDLQHIREMLIERHISSRLTNLPLEDLGLGALKTGASPSLLDRVWSQASRSVFDGSHEWYYLAYPVLDYWFHYRGQVVPGWSLLEYLKRRLKVENARDFWERTFRKLLRMVSSLCR